MLARKTVFAKTLLTVEQVIDEMAHLQKMDHAHVIRLVGSYAMGREISILMYPVADYNLDDFHDQILLELQDSHTTQHNMIASHSSFIRRLTAAVKYLHESYLKHMDIKPQNILVRPRYGNECGRFFSPYITDFGISRAYRNLDAVETDGATSFTWKYAAPEVVRQDTRGVSADIFSLGCVFTEIYAVQRDTNLELEGLFDARPDVEVRHRVIRKTHFNSLRTLIEGGKDERASYHANIEAVTGWFPPSRNKNGYYFDGLALERLKDKFYVAHVLRMLSRDPSLRPTAQELSDVFQSNICCDMGQETLEAAQEEYD